jgi:hypothetical protein
MLWLVHILDPSTHGLTASMLLVVSYWVMIMYIVTASMAQLFDH